MTDKRDFDSAAATWDEEPRRVKLAREVADAIIDRAKPTRDMDALDFGCGTGLLTLCLQPHLRSITGIDSSGGMLEVLERKVEEQGLTNVRTAFFDMDRDGLPAGKFHLIVSSMTLHHIKDTASLIRLFHDLLLPGGSLCIADLDREDGTFHDNLAGVVHLGFDRMDIMGVLTGAGFTRIRSVTAAVVHKSSSVREADYPVFLISAVRR